MNEQYTKHEEQTQIMYGSLFDSYSEKQFDESVGLFFVRHNKWNIDKQWFEGKKCLDAGCGGGRYVVAMAQCGADVVGVDISKSAIQNANKRIFSRGLEKKASVKVASVLDLPFEDNTFDYIVCSGVIHHTPDPRKAFAELTRVLKPGGTLWLSVYGRYGLVWFFTCDLWRYTICKLVSFKIMENIWKLLGVPANKRYNYLDNMYVPYCFRYTEKTLKKWFDEEGYQKRKRVKFERYDYEKIKSRVLYGSGWQSWRLLKPPCSKYWQ